MPTILLVDDDPALVAAFETVLTLEGYAVRTASSAKQALQELAQARPGPHPARYQSALPPDADRLDLLRSFRGYLPQVPVIVVSGYLDDATCQAALATGARDCWQKPVDLQTLTKRVAHALATPQP